MTADWHEYYFCVLQTTGLLSRLLGLIFVLLYQFLLHYATVNVLFTTKKTLTTLVGPE
jgi:hypothetical protein